MKTLILIAGLFLAEPPQAPPVQGHECGCNFGGICRCGSVCTCDGILERDRGLKWQTLYFCTQDACPPCLAMQKTLDGYPLVGIKIVPLDYEFGLFQFLKVRRTPTLLLTDTSGKIISRAEGPLTPSQLADFVAGRPFQTAPLRSTVPLPRRRR